MNALLIHANNLDPNLVNKFPGDKVALDYSQSIQRSNFILDRFLHEELLHAFRGKEYQVVFIPYSLSQQNYLELTGLRVAAHVRTTEEFNHQYVPIAFVGPETPEQIARLTDLGNILFTSGIFSTTSQEPEFLKKLFDRIMDEKPKVTESEYKKGIERLQLSPPANYQSHHSIDNELALLRWSEYLKCDDRIPEVKENLKVGLYFKYHRVLNALNTPGTANPFPISGKGKILLIDDEAKKGWADFYRCFFQNNINNKSIEFEALLLDFKSLIRQDITEAARKGVEQFDADVVLLDLRLCDMDFGTDPQPEPKDLTGYKILEEIKKINKGTQVIITTASNKVWNYQSLVKAGADGYVVKRGTSNVEADIKNLSETISYGINRADFLKYVNDEMVKIMELINDNDLFNSKNDTVRKKMESNLEIAFSLLNKASEIDKYYNYSYLQVFLCLEEFLKLESVCRRNSEELYINCGQQEFLVLNGDNCAMTFKNGHYTVGNARYDRRVDTNFKMSAVLLFRHNCATSGEKSWRKIYSVRNTKAAHPEKGIVSKDELKLLLNFIIYVADESNISLRQEEDALEKPTMKQKLEQLKEKYSG